jgi:hypothetical protein
MKRKILILLTLILGIGLSSCNNKTIYTGVFTHDENINSKLMKSYVEENSINDFYCVTPTDLDLNMEIYYIDPNDEKKNFAIEYKNKLYFAEIFAINTYSEETYSQVAYYHNGTKNRIYFIFCYGSGIIRYTTFYFDINKKSFYYNCINPSDVTDKIGNPNNLYFINENNQISLYAYNSSSNVKIIDDVVSLPSSTNKDFYMSWNLE